jgi:hypothetical protein
MRTHGSFNHPGLMKSRSRSCYDDQPNAAVAGHDPTIGGPIRVATRVGPFLMERRNRSRLR